jgi:hypothetical protein
MKARIQLTDASILLAHAHPDYTKQGEGCATLTIRTTARSLARSDYAARIARIKMLKAQVDAGTYMIDSRAIAQQMQCSSVICDTSECETHDVFSLEDPVEGGTSKAYR